MKTLARFLGIFAGLLLAGGAGCGGDGGTTDPGPEPGVLVVSLTTPNADDGNALRAALGGYSLAVAESGG